VVSQCISLALAEEVQNIVPPYFAKWLIFPSKLLIKYFGKRAPVTIFSINTACIHLPKEPSNGW